MGQRQEQCHTPTACLTITPTAYSVPWWCRNNATPKLGYEALQGFRRPISQADLTVREFNLFGLFSNTSNLCIAFDCHDMDINCVIHTKPTSIILSGVRGCTCLTVHYSGYPEATPPPPSKRHTWHTPPLHTLRPHLHHHLKGLVLVC